MFFIFITGCPFSPMSPLLNAKPDWTFAMSPSVPALHSPAIAQGLQVFANDGVELVGFLHLGVEGLAELGHFGLEGDAVVFDGSGPGVATGGEYVVVLLNFLEAGRLAVAGNIFVGVAGFGAPVVVGLGDASDVFFAQFLLGTADHGADFTGVDKEGLVGTVAVAALGVALFVLGEEPEAYRDLGRKEELAGKGDHAVDEVVLHQFLADGSFARGVGGHGPVSKDEPGSAVLGELGQHVKDPGVVGVAGGRGIIAAPAGIGGELVVGPPVLEVEGRVGHDEVGLEVGVLILEKVSAGTSPRLAERRARRGSSWPVCR